MIHIDITAWIAHIWSKTYVISFAQAIHDYVANEADELSFKVLGRESIFSHSQPLFILFTFAQAGDIVYVLDMSETDWWKARIKGKEGQVNKQARKLQATLDRNYES